MAYLLQHCRRSFGVSTHKVDHVTTRLFYSWLIEVFNRKDTSRVKEVGPDRAAAEWIIRNGGKVKYSNSITWLNNYVTLPYGKNLELVQIDADGVSLTSNGLQHLAGLKSLHHLDLTGCRHITHLESLPEVADSLVYLNLTGCTGVSDLSPLATLKKLETLILIDTLGGSKRNDVISALKRELTACNIIDEPIEIEKGSTNQ